MKKKCPMCGRNRAHHFFGKNASRKDGIQTYCKDCRSKYDAARFRKKEVSSAQAKRRLANRIRLRDMVRKEKSKQGCNRCGITDYRVLDFHHVRGVKLGCIANMVKMEFGTSRIKDEMAKCKVLCANCHRIEHCETKGC